MNPFHPDFQTLNSFASGELPDKVALVVSSHVNHCSTCMTQISIFEETLAESTFSATEVETLDLSDILNSVLELKPQSVIASPVPREVVSVGGQTIELPVQLNSISSHIGSWRSAGRKISYAKIDVYGSSNLYLVYFEKGAKIPEHGHEGNEYAYVIAGSFRDQSSDYVSGDFVRFDTSDSHHPHTEDPDGCLLLVCVEGPFVFKEGLARLLNPFRRLLF